MLNVVKAARVDTVMVKRFGSGTQWEPVVGYSRAVRAGPFVFVAGTTATDADGRFPTHAGAYHQARRALDNVRVALERTGAGLKDVVQTRLYVTSIDLWEEVGRAHGEVFGEIRPVTALVEVSRLIDPADAGGDRGCRLPEFLTIESCREGVGRARGEGAGLPGDRPSRPIHDSASASGPG